MKRIIPVIVLLLAGFAAYRLFFQASPTSFSPSTLLTNTPASPTPPPPPTITIGNETFAYQIIRVASGQSITLIPNFSPKHATTTLIEENKCTSAINGGFYDTSDKPLGLFVTDGQELGSAIPSALFNGFISITRGSMTTIAEEAPLVAPIALQTGPILMENGSHKTLAINNDEHARRMVAAEGPGGQMIFLTVYGMENVFDGPLLADLPEIVSTISANESLRITRAINLDGGTASMFTNGSVTLSELQPVGSLFCIR